jgi:thiazole synthase ThiGH ThiG subunit
MIDAKGLSPEFIAKIKKLETLMGVDFTAKEEKQIAAADDPAAKAAAIAKAHHGGYQSRQGGKFAPGRVGAAYYKQGKP